ncbi:MAG: hypothetical protein ACWGQW_02755 [bacterium]
MLITQGHHPTFVWSYTPKQIAGYITLSTRRLRMEYAHQLTLNTLAARGDPKEVKKRHEELSKNVW